MTKLRVLFASLVVLLVLTAFPSVTRAYDTWPDCMLGGRAFGYSGSLYGLGYVPVPPYFALHPPVYYGERVYRTYGESPFARPARSSRPQRFAVQLITNPFVDQLASDLPSIELPEQTTDVNQVTVKPQMIINPYYKADEEVVQK